MCNFFGTCLKPNTPANRYNLPYLNILLFYFIEIILLNLQIEFDLRRTFCPVVCLGVLVPSLSACVCLSACPPPLSEDCIFLES